MSYIKARLNTTKLMEMVYDGEVDPKRLIENLVNWMSEAEVTEFMERNGYMEESEDEDDEE